VELNNTFYHFPRKQSLEHWRSEAPDEFKYAVKANRGITHYKKMRDIQSDLKRFLHMIKPLGKALGPILYQLPPDLHFDESLLIDLFEIHPQKYKYVLEFRHGSWFCDETFDLLRRNNVAFCIHDHHKRKSPFVTTADFVYIRLHGPDGQYGGDYSKGFLEDLAGRIKDFSDDGKEVFCFFNNDAEGYAVKNALELKEMAEG
jgi:uncharacterized protein YecE (DUF72 family)